MKKQDHLFRCRMDESVSSIQAAGLDPYSQLSGYLRTGDDAYITRHENARLKIRILDREKIFQYMQEHLIPGAKEALSPAPQVK